MKNIVVFASGSGTNFQSIIDAAKSGRLEANIAGLVANRKGIGAIDRARRHGIPVEVTDAKHFDNFEAYEHHLLQVLRQWQTHFIALAGYLRKIPASVIRAYPRRIVNIHPALLPKYGGKGYYGERVHRAVIKHGDTESGCSIHFVTEKYDEGPVIARRRVPVYDDDTAETLAARVLQQEHQLYPQVLQQLIKGEIPDSTSTKSS